MNLPKQFREFGVLNSINPLSPDAQVLFYNMLQTFNASRWPRKLVVRTQTLENQCGMTRKRLTVARNTLIQRGLIRYYPARQASGSPAYEIVLLYDEKNEPVFPTETHRGTQDGTHRGTQDGTQDEHLLKTKGNKTKLSKSHSDATASAQEKKVTEYWEKLVETWFCFYGEKFRDGPAPAKPIFNGAQGELLKKIVVHLKSLAKKKDYEWSEAYAGKCLTGFLQKAWDHDEWMRNNFELGNLLQKFNSITNTNGASTNRNTGGKTRADDLRTGQDLTESILATTLSELEQ